MCQAKINYHYGGKAKCLRDDTNIFNVTIEYKSGHLKGKIKRFTKTLCQKHSKIFRYNLNRKADKGHLVTVSN